MRPKVWMGKTTLTPTVMVLIELHTTGVMGVFQGARWLPQLLLRQAVADHFSQWGILLELWSVGAVGITCQTSPTVGLHLGTVASC